MPYMIKPRVNIILNGKYLKAFPLKSGTKQGCPLSPLLFNIVLEVLTTAIREKRNKRNPDWKRSKTLTVCRWQDPLPRKPQDSTKKLLELINEYSKVERYKINTQKSLAFLHTNNKKSEREVKETIPFTIATKRIKYLGINPRRQKTCIQKTIRH